MSTLVAGSGMMETSLRTQPRFRSLIKLTCVCRRAAIVGHKGDVKKVDSDRPGGWVPAWAAGSRTPFGGIHLDP
jgi:hypothetical protein